MPFSERFATFVGALLGGFIAGGVVAEGVYLFGYSKSWIYIAGVISALIGAVIGGGFASWSCNVEWKTR